MPHTSYPILSEPRTWVAELIVRVGGSWKSKSVYKTTTSVFLRSARYLRLGEYLTSCAKRLECIPTSTPRNDLFVLGIAYLVATWLLSRDSNPDHEGMNLVCYPCTTQLYYKAHFSLLSRTSCFLKFAVHAPLLVQNAGIEPFPRFPKPVCKTITLHSGYIGIL